MPHWERKTVYRTERLKSTTSGNPMYRVHFTDGTSARTYANAACAYDLQNQEYIGRPVDVEFTRSRVSRVEIPDDEAQDGVGERARGGNRTRADDDRIRAAGAGL
jgi:hypothetical protein